MYITGIVTIRRFYMGLFGALRNFFIKQRIASLIADIFRRQEIINHFSANECATISYDIVNAAWVTIPDLFDGKFGGRPHDFAIAAYALGLKIHDTNPNFEDSQFLSFALALNIFLQEFRVNGRLYNFQSSDVFLFEKAFDFAIEHQRQWALANPEKAYEYDVSGIIEKVLDQAGCKYSLWLSGELASKAINALRPKLDDGTFGALPNTAIVALYALVLASSDHKQNDPDPSYMIAAHILYKKIEDNIQDYILKDADQYVISEANDILDNIKR